MTFGVREATVDDVPRIAAIYNQGIEDRIATFETRLRSEDDVRGWFDGVHPICVAEQDGQVVAFAASSAYRARECYAGIAEVSIYVERSARGKGVGHAALRALVVACERRGFWKLVSRVFVENQASRGLVRASGFREVGTYERHARLDGQWRDVVIVEKLIGEAAKN
ncbi:MAG TPA: arsinothricin resistance N-acetyltransferase ArsN1 family A [Myxococcales bacterium]